MLIFLNQIRMKIGVMFGNPETTTGGNALKFYASLRMEIRRIGQIKDRDEVVGNQTRVKVVKNKLAPPFRQVEFDIMYGEGISKVGELIDLGVKAGVVEKSGAWFSYDSQRIGQGRENAKQFLRDHKDMADKIEAKVREQSGVVANLMLATEDEAERRRKRRSDPERQRRFHLNASASWPALCRPSVPASPHHFRNRRVCNRRPAREVRRRRRGSRAIAGTVCLLTARPAP